MVKADYFVSSESILLDEVEYLSNFTLLVVLNIIFSKKGVRSYYYLLLI